MFYAALLLFYLAELIDNSFWHQALFIFSAVAVSLLIDWLAANANSTSVIELEDGKLALLGTTITIADLKEILYCQTKRFEHRLRFCFANATYRDFEISSADLIDDLRLYHYLVSCGLPIKMLQDDHRLF